MNKSDVERSIEYVQSVVVYRKYLTRLIAKFPVTKLKTFCGNRQYGQPVTDKNRVINERSIKENALFCRGLKRVFVENPISNKNPITED